MTAPNSDSTEKVADATLTESKKSTKMPVAVAITGASGGKYALRLLAQLLHAGEQVYLMISQAGLMVLAMEEGLKLSNRPKEIQKRLIDYFQCEPNQLQVFGEQDWLAPPASGSAKLKGMVIIPCTTGTLGAIAAGVSNCLINRSADVCLKEKKPLIIVVRETPFSSIHLENMLRLSQAGATIMPANPGFYHHPETIMDIIDFMVARVLDHLGVPQQLLEEWGK
ncbi:flavin prenyltransferase UbiX [Ostreibacterium oceani]|nr:flavin prenyltransferase UbiX [Ostreibacterium oceani]